MKSNETVSLCLIQSDIDPNNVSANLYHYRELLGKMTVKPDIIIFPEMFNSGFSSHLDRLSEKMSGQSAEFLKDTAKLYQCDVVASLAISEEGNIFNRLLWIIPDGIANHYDKHHLFFGDERAFCSPGSEKITVSSHGFSFLPLICYEIRFPKWCRNHYQNGKFYYDCLLFIANFPAPRSETLRILAQARAIENEAYVVVLNRVGLDGNGNSHNGNSMIINPLGEIIASAPENKEFLLETSVDKNFLERLRKKFPVYKDWD
jgi:omega-amidase